MLNNIHIDPLYKFDMTFMPIEKIPNYFSLEKYYQEIATKDFDNDGVSNMYELAINKNIYQADKLTKNDLKIVTKTLTFNIDF